jgi:hypothetical protein
VHGNLYALEFRMQETVQQQTARARRPVAAPPPPALRARRTQTILRLGPLVVAWSRPA